MIPTLLIRESGDRRIGDLWRDFVSAEPAYPQAGYLAAPYLTCGRNEKIAAFRPAVFGRDVPQLRKIGGVQSDAGFAPGFEPTGHHLRMYVVRLGNNNDHRRR